MSELPELFYDNILNQSGVVFSVTSAVGTSADRLNDFAKTLQWEATSTAGQQINVAGTVSIAADSWIIDNHNLSGVSIALKGSTDNFVGSDELVDTVEPSDNDNILRHFTEETFQYYRVSIASTSVAAKIGELFVGSKVQIPTNPIIPHDTDKQRDESVQSFNNWGYKFARERFDRKVFDLLFRGMDNEDQYEIWKDHWKFCRGFRPFFYCFRPTTVPEDVVLVLDITGRLFCPLNGRIRSGLQKRFEEVF